MRVELRRVAFRALHFTKGQILRADRTVVATENRRPCVTRYVALTKAKQISEKVLQ